MVEWSERLKQGKPYDMWLAVRVSVSAENTEQAERRAFEGVTEMLCQLLAAEASEVQREPHQPHKPTVLHFSEVAVRVLNQMSADKRDAETMNEIDS